MHSRWTALNPCGCEEVTTHENSGHRESAEGGLIFKPDDMVDSVRLDWNRVELLDREDTVCQQECGVTGWVHFLHISPQGLWV